MFILGYTFYVAHNPEVAGSNPVPATNTKGLRTLF